MNSTTAMEEIAKCWGLMGPRRNSGGGEPSWEEQAFARDAAGHLGGCVWPPRSYLCSFCRREFRSAQALGGHMNVHRRDRARLRQCSSSDGDTQDTPHDKQPQHQDTFLHSKLPNPSSTCSSPPPSYLSTMIKESQNKVFMSKLMTREAIDHDQDEEEEEQVRRMKRRRLDHDHPVVAIPLFSAGCDREELLAGVGHGIAKVPKIIASPSSSLLLVGQQEVDLELRLGNGNGNGN